MKDSLKSNAISCITSGCHDVIHDVKNLANVEFWDSTNAKKAVPAHEATKSSSSSEEEE